MEKQIFKGRTKEDAIKNAEKSLNTERRFLSINVIEDVESKTVFSILDRSNVTIEVTIDKEKEKEVLEKEKRQDKRKNRLTENDIENNINKLENILDKFNENIKNKFEYKVEERNSDLYVNIESENNAKMIGRKGENLNAFQNYLQTFLRRNCRPYTRVYLNVGEYKENRKAKLENLAYNAAQSVLTSGQELELEPMNSYDRKIIHNFLQNNPEVYTESKGTEPNRKIVIHIK